MKKFSKGQTIHKSKYSAQRVGSAAKKAGVPYKIIKVKGGYRVDKQY